MKFQGFAHWIEIFRGGKQVDSEGVEHDGDEVIDRAIATFDPATHEPPITVGHPKHNDPAFGWIEALKTGVKDGVKVLLAKGKQVVPEFEEMVKQGLFKKRSASFYPDGRLRHVGFLGAMPPAVKGLADLKFEDDGAVVFEFGELEEARAARDARSKKYKIGIKEGGNLTKPSEWEDVPDDQWLDPVNYRYPCPDADQTRAAAGYWGQEKNREQYNPEERSIMDERLDKFREKFKTGEYRKEETNMSGFKEKVKGLLSFLGVDVSKVPDEALPDSAPEGTGEKTFSEAELEAARKKAEEDGKKKAEDDYAEKERGRLKEAREKEIAAFCDQGIKEGRILPAWVKSGLKEFMESLDAEDTVQFSEGDSGKKSRFDWFKCFVEELPKAVEFKEIAKWGDQTSDFVDKDQVEAGLRIAARVNPPETK